MTTRVNYRMIDGAAVNILDFGADPSGASDSTVAIQAAIDAASAVIIPAGSFKYSNLNITKNNFVFRSEGGTLRGGTLNITNSSNVLLDNMNFLADFFDIINVIEITDSDNISIRDSIIDGNGFVGDIPNPGFAATGIKMRNSTDVDITQNTIMNAETNWGVDIGSCSRVSVSSNYIHHTGRSGIEVLSNCDDIRIIDNTLHKCHINWTVVNDGVIGSYGPDNFNIIIKGNSIFDCGGPGDTPGGSIPLKCIAIRIQGAQDVIVADNRINCDNMFAALYAQERSGVQCVNVSFERNTVLVTENYNYICRAINVAKKVSFEGNTFRVIKDNLTLPGPGIEIRSTNSEFSICDNKLIEKDSSDITGSFISFISVHPDSDSVKFKINRNTIRSQYTPIAILGDCNRFNISDNDMKYTQGSDGGVFISSGSSNGVVTNNIVDGALAVKNNGTNVTVANNILTV